MTDVEEAAHRRARVWRGSYKGWVEPWQLSGKFRQKTQLMETVAVCDIVEEHAHYGASRTREAKPYTDFASFLGHGLDAVIVATPVPLHAEQTIAILDRGSAVLSEVTPVNSLTEAAQLAAAVKRTGGFHTLAKNYCFIDDVVLVKRMHDDGRFGTIA